MEIHTRRLRLRERKLADGAQTTRYRNHPAFLEHYPWSVWTHDQTLAELGIAVESARRTPRRSYMLAIELAANGHPLVGCCRIEAHDVDDRVEIGYDLSPDHWGRGLATEGSRRSSTGTSRRRRLPRSRRGVWQPTTGPSGSLNAWGSGGQRSFPAVSGRGT